MISDQTRTNLISSQPYFLAAFCWSFHLAALFYRHGERGLADTRVSARRAFIVPIFQRKQRPSYNRTSIQTETLSEMAALQTEARSELWIPVFDMFLCWRVFVIKKVWSWVDSNFSASVRCDHWSELWMKIRFSRWKIFTPKQCTIIAVRKVLAFPHLFLYYRGRVLLESSSEHEWWYCQFAVVGFNFFDSLSHGIRNSSLIICSYCPTSWCMCERVDNCGVPDD